MDAGPVASLGDEQPVAKVELVQIEQVCVTALPRPVVEIGARPAVPA